MVTLTDNNDKYGPNLSAPSQETISGLNGADTIQGGPSDDLIYGGIGDDSLFGDAFKAQYGGTGEDTVFGDQGNDIIFGGNGDGLLYGGADNDTIFGDNGNDNIFGDGGDDSIVGGNGNDYIELGGGADTVFGSLVEYRGNGADFIADFDTTGTDVDVIVIDSIYGADTRSVFVGNGHLDLDNDSSDDLDVPGTSGLYWQRETAAGHTIFTLLQPLFTEGPDTVDLSGIDLSPYGPVGDALGGDDRVTLQGGNSADDTFTGGEGNDLILGSGDAEMILGGSGNDSILAAGGFDLVYGGNGSDQLSGGGSADTLHGDVGQDSLAGDDGGDLLYGGDENDYLEGGADADTLYGDTADDTLAGGNGNDLIYGGDGWDSLVGGEGDDSLFGADGSDNIDGGNGNDFIKDGPLNTETVHGDGGNDTILTGAGAGLIYGDDGDDSIVSSGSEYIHMGDGSDTLSGSLGALSSFIIIRDFDTVSGGDVDRIVVDTVLGDDTRVVFTQADDSLDLDGNGSGDIQVVGTKDLEWRREVIDDRTHFFLAVPLFTDEADTIDLDTVDFGLYGNVTDALDGDDRVTLTSASDRDDEFVGGNGNDLVGGGTDDETVQGGNGDDTLSGGGGDDVLYGNDDRDRLDGGAGNDTLVPGMGIDRIVTGGGSDLVGGVREALDDDTVADFTPGSTAGSDRVAVEGAVAALEGSQVTAGLLNLGDGNLLTLQLNGIGITGTAHTSFSDGLTFISIETTANPTNGSDVIAASDKSNALDGKDGNDALLGAGGNDTLKGGNGNDLLDGGADNDAGYGGNGNDTILGGEGSDTIYGETGADRGEGGDGDDRLEGGAGADTMDGGNGNDTILGGADADLLIGGAGADRLQGDAGGDRIVLGLDGADDGRRDTIFGTVADLSGDTLLGFAVGGKATAGADVIAVTGLASANGKYLDSIVLTGNVLSLSKVGGGTITFEDLADGPHYTDTVLGSSGEILLYVV